MMIYLITAVLLLGVLAALVNNARTVQLKRMAHTLNLRYDKQVDSVLLPDSSAKAQFFNRELHQFYHVLTFREPGAFVRVCEDRIFASPLDKTPLYTYTLVTAELTKGNFTPFVLMPRTKAQTPDSNLPSELATRYVLSAPNNFTLPPTVVGFLKAHGSCYVECTQNALVYCEFNTVPVPQLQPLRFRALQLLKELVKKPQPVTQTVQAAVTPAKPLTDAELQAQILLRLQSASPAVSSAANSTGGRYVYGFILLILLSGMLFMAWYALQHWAAR